MILSKKHKNIFFGAVIALPTFWGTESSAFVVDDEFRIEETVAVKVKLIDQATGGCWASLKVAQEYAEEKLRSIGAAIDNNAQTHHENTYQFSISVMAARVSSSNTNPCWGSTIIRLHKLHSINGIIHLAEVMYREAIIMQEENFNNAVLDQINFAINELE